MGTAVSGQPLKFGDQVLAGDRTHDQPAEAFAGVLIDDGDELDRPTVGGDVELEVRGPHAVERIGGHSVRRGRGSVAFTPPLLRYPQALVTPKTLDLLVIDVPTLTAGIVKGGAEPAARWSLA